MCGNISLIMLLGLECGENFFILHLTKGNGIIYYNHVLLLLDKDLNFGPYPHISRVLIFIE